MMVMKAILIIAAVLTIMFVVVVVFVFATRVRIVVAAAVLDATAAQVVLQSLFPGHVSGMFQGVCVSCFGNGIDRWREWLCKK